MRTLPVPLVVPSPMLLVNQDDVFFVYRSLVNTQVEGTLRVTGGVKAVIPALRRHKVRLQSLAIKIVVVFWRRERWKSVHCCWRVWKSWI